VEAIKPRKALIAQQIDQKKRARTDGDDAADARRCWLTNDDDDDSSIIVAYQT